MPEQSVSIFLGNGYQDGSSPDNPLYSPSTINMTADISQPYKAASYQWDIVPINMRWAGPQQYGVPFGFSAGVASISVGEVSSLSTSKAILTATIDGMVYTAEKTVYIAASNDPNRNYKPDLRYPPNYGKIQLKKGDPLVITVADRNQDDVSFVLSPHGYGTQYGFNPSVGVVPGGNGSVEVEVTNQIVGKVGRVKILLQDYALTGVYYCDLEIVEDTGTVDPPVDPPDPPVDPPVDPPDGCECQAEIDELKARVTDLEAKIRGAGDIFTS